MSQPKRIPHELSMRCDDAGYSTPTWDDIKYQCESGLDLCVPDEDFYSLAEQRKLRPMFKRWLAKAQREIGYAALEPAQRDGEDRS